MKYYPSRSRFHCPTKVCSHEVSLRTNTFFAKSMLPIHKILHIGYLWLKGDSWDSIRGSTKHAKQTVGDFMQHYRDLVTDSLDCIDCRIGGPGIEVELDESKMGRRKYNRGH